MESNAAKEFDFTEDLLQEINILHISDLHFGVGNSEHQKKYTESKGNFLLEN